MKKKIFLNVFYNLMLIISVFGMIWSYNNKSPLIIVFFAAIFGSFVYLKIQLIKDLRNTLKK